MRDRNIVIISKIVKYSNEIADTVSRFELDLNKFSTDHVVKNAISMCLLQIGELIGKLSDEFRTEHNKVAWRDYVAIRNRAAHAYGSMDVEILWKIATDDIPKLSDYCRSIIKEQK